MRKIAILLLAFLCMSQLALSADCPSFNSADLLQSGKKAFMRGGSSNSEFTYQAPISYPIPSWGFQFATTASSISGYNPSYGGFNFLVSGRRKGSQNYIQINLVINPNQAWTSVQISYLVSSRSDMVVWNGDYAVNSWVKKGGSNIYDVVSTIQKPLPDASYKVAAFISGFSTTDSQPKVSINQRSFNQRSRQLVLTIFCGSNPLPVSLTISYIIYPDNHPYLTITFGQPTGDTGAYQISGPTSFARGIQYSEFKVANRYLTCTGNECQKPCILTQDCQQLEGNVYQGQCIFCATGIVFEYGLCTRRCGPNQIYTNRVCVCAKGFVRRGKNCISNAEGNGNGNQCARDQIFRNNRCIRCPAGSYPNPPQNNCICPPGQSYGADSNSCGNDCKFPYSWNGNRCGCPSDSIEVNQQCIQCPVGSTPNSAQSACVCQNGYNYDSTSNKCTPACPFGSSWNGQRCSCPPNSIFLSGQCIQCPYGSTLNSTQNTCVCQGGYNYDSASNKCSPSCPFGSSWNGQRCLCPSNSIYAQNGQCIQCPVGSNSNSDQSACLCQGGYTYDKINNKCSPSCPFGSTWNGKGCSCPSNSITTQNGQCVQCPAGSNPNPTQTACICTRPDQKYDSNAGRCVNACEDVSQVWRNGQCACLKGYITWQGKCRSCPGNSQPSKDLTTCVCLSKTAIYLPQQNICVECGANAFPNPSKTACQCSNGYQLQGQLCVPKITCDFNQDLVNGRCECKYGWKNLGGSCVQICGLNQYWNGNVCSCNEGTARISGACRPCPTGSLPNSDKTNCICQNRNQIFVFAQSTCVDCPRNSFPNSLGSQCDCIPGYTYTGTQCVSKCTGQLYPNEKGDCVCPSGKVFNAGSCITPTLCPRGSSFNVAGSNCVCDNRSLNLINGVCQACIDNSVWRGSECVCQTGFFKIAGSCQVCDPRTSYNGKDCVCNLGYFGTRDLCTACHPSCSQCTGPDASQCLSCSDVSLVLQKGFCTKPSPCTFGYFLDNTQCVRCIDNCIDCESIFECKTCALGYAEKKLSVSGQDLVNCEQICGDGIKFEQQCDDGNTVDGDGCSSTCTEEKGWFCSGGSSNNPSICKKFTPDQIQLSAKGAVNLGSEVVMSIRASYLPPCITQNECSECFKALVVNVVDVKVPVITTVNYIPFSQYQFLVKIDFKPAFVTSIFKVVIKLNPAYKGCFAEEDLFQQFELTVDPAFLKTYEKEETLCPEDILAGSTSGSSSCITVPPASNRILGL